jgi:hypothetical protein
MLDEDALCSLAPMVPRDRVLALAAVAGSDVQGLVDRLFELSASLGDDAVDATVGALETVSHHDPEAANSARFGERCLTDGFTAFARLPAELLGAVLTLSAMGSFSLTCKEAHVLVSAYVSTEMISLSQPKQLRGWSVRRCLGLFGAARGLRRLELSGQGAQGSSLLLRAFELGVMRRLEHLSISAAGAYATAENGIGLSASDLADQDAVAEVLYELPAQLTQLGSLALIDCPALNDALTERLSMLPALTHLCLDGNRQISQEVVSTLLHKSAAGLRTASFAFCGDRLQAHRAAGVSAEPRRASAAAAAGLMGLPTTPGTAATAPDVLAPGVSHSAVDASSEGAAAAALALAETEVEAAGQAAFAAAVASADQISRRVMRVRAAPSLVSLSFRGWSRIAVLQLDAQQLITLNVSQATALTLLHLRTPSLTELNATGCRALGEVYLCRCANLRHWSLAQCKSVHVLSGPAVSRLESLNVFGCRRLPSAALMPLLRSSTATLRRLDLNGAIGTAALTEADLRRACPNLEALDCRGRASKY